MRFSDIIKDYFTFTRAEKRGVFVLLSILFLLIIADEVIPLVIRPKSVDISGFENEIKAFEESIRIEDSIEAMTHKSGYKKRNSNSAIHKMDSSFSSRRFPKETFMIELNSADTFTLQRLRGIGPSFARRIVKYRERLGGYLDKIQLLEIWEMDTSRYNSIKEQITVNRDSVHKINLNTITFKKLMSHPYFPFEMTREIMIYRKEHKKFVNVEELRNIRMISDSVYRKIRSYIKVEN
jgi:DNA uptake protein ComE-like DNA-binding protein